MFLDEAWRRCRRRTSVGAVASRTGPAARRAPPSAGPGAHHRRRSRRHDRAHAHCIL